MLLNIVLTACLTVIKHMLQDIFILFINVKWLIIKMFKKKKEVLLFTVFLYL